MTTTIVLLLLAVVFFINHQCRAQTEIITINQIGQHRPMGTMKNNTQFREAAYQFFEKNIAEIIDRLMIIDDVEIYDGIKFIRDKTKHPEIVYSARNDNSSPMVKIFDLLQSHRIEIRFNQLLSNAYAIEEGRRRRNNMMPLMMFGMVLMGMVMIPMGFKFLAVLGGKALLLAKMALLLSSIQGLKKVATSNLNYGLYQQPPANPWHYDRQWYGGNQLDNHNLGILPPYNDINEENHDLISGSYSYTK